MIMIFGFLFLTLQAPAAQVVELDQLVVQVLERNRDVLAARRVWEAAQTRPSQESTLPNPTISLTSVNSGILPLPGRSIGMEPQSYVSPMVMQEVPFPGKLRLQGEIAQKESDSLARLYEAAKLKAVNELKHAYFGLYQAEKSLATVEKNKQLLNQLAEIARVRYEVGSGLQQDVLKAHLEATMLEERLTMSRQRRESYVAKINQLMNRAPDTPLGRVGDIEPSTLSFTLEQLYASAQEANPILDSRRIMIDRSARRLDLAKKQYMPDFNVQAGYMYMGQFPNLWNVQIGAQIPLYFWRKERKGVEEAAADLRGSTNEYEAMAQDTFREVKDEYLMLTTAERLMRLYKDAIIPQASLALESSLSAYRVGSLDFLTILNNWTIVLNFELEYHNQLAQHETALSNLERLTDLQLVRSRGVR
jgi:outer membrane protein, heavy metal efflux system